MLRSGWVAAVAVLVGLAVSSPSAAAPLVAATDADGAAADEAGTDVDIDVAESPADPGAAAPVTRVAPAQRWQGHHRQIGVGVQTGVGLRAIKPYDSEYCGQRDGNGGGDAAACLGRQPIAFDLELTWGATPHIELLLEARIGLERDFGATAFADAGPRVFRLAPGARFYVSESGRTSFFSTAQLMVDLSGYEDAAGQGRGADVGIRNVNGILVDLHPAYGLYVFLGETASFRRWLAAELEAGLGIQGRYP